MTVRAGSFVVGERGSPVSYEIKTLDLSHREFVNVLQAEIELKLGKNYIPAPPERVEAMLEQGLSFGLFIENSLEGIRLVNDRRLLSALLREALALPPDEETDVAQLAGVYVRDRFSGNKFGLLMTQLAVDALRAVGRKHLFSTVAPSNHANLKNLKALGFEEKAAIVLAGGAERLVMYHRAN